jgi:hypothetical protein
MPVGKSPFVFCHVHESVSPTVVVNGASVTSPLPEKSFVIGDPVGAVVLGGGTPLGTVTVTVEIAVVVTMFVTVFTGCVIVIGGDAWLTVRVTVRARDAQTRVLLSVRHCPARRVTCRVITVAVATPANSNAHSPAPSSALLLTLPIARKGVTEQGKIKVASKSSPQRRFLTSLGEAVERPQTA